MIIVSTDGSCLRNPGGAVGWAWVNHQGPTGSGGAQSGTNQVAELTAVLEALRAHPGSEPMVIETDSQYAVNCATEWLPGWKRRGWKTAAGSPVSNRELIVAIDNELSDRSGPVRFRWVRGHVGNHFNEMADRLAGAAARDVAGGTGSAGGTDLAGRTGVAGRTDLAGRTDVAGRTAPTTEDDDSSRSGSPTSGPARTTQATKTSQRQVSPQQRAAARQPTATRSADAAQRSVAATADDSLTLF